MYKVYNKKFTTLQKCVAYASTLPANLGSVYIYKNNRLLTVYYYSIYNILPIVNC